MKNLPRGPNALSALVWRICLSVVISLSGSTWGADAFCSDPSLKLPVDAGSSFIRNINAGGSTPAIDLIHSAAGNFNPDQAEEVAADFGPKGVWLYDNGGWTQLSPLDPETLMAADVNGDGRDEILADLGSNGLWLWNAGAWNQLSAVDVENVAAGDVDGDGIKEIIGDFGPAGLWLEDGDAWTQLSGVNVDRVITIKEYQEDYIVGDFGSLGLWVYYGGSMGGYWQNQSIEDADGLVAVADSSVNQWVVGDFGSKGLWIPNYVGAHQLSGADADDVISIHSGIGADELLVDFGPLGLWYLIDLVNPSWIQYSGPDAEFMITAKHPLDWNPIGVVVDFGQQGLWLKIDPLTPWQQLSGLNPDGLLAAELDGDWGDEIIAAFGAYGLWLWNAGTWVQVALPD
jgi:hypothetical protein